MNAIIRGTNIGKPENNYSGTGARRPNVQQHGSERAPLFGAIAKKGRETNEVYYDHSEAFQPVQEPVKFLAKAAINGATGGSSNIATFIALTGLVSQVAAAQGNHRLGTA